MKQTNCSVGQNEKRRIHHPRGTAGRSFLPGIGQFALLLLLLAASAVSLAQTEGEGKIIDKVLVQGNNKVKTDTILDKIQSRPGAVFSARLVAEDTQRIIGMPQIFNVKWFTRLVEDKVELTFSVTETPQIAAVEFVGNKHIETKDLKKKLGFWEGDFLDQYLIRQGQQDLEDFYHQKGYHFAKVTLDKKKLQDELKVSYEIVEGPKLRVKKVEFEGNENIPDRKLAGKVKTKPYFPIFRKGLLDEEILEQDSVSVANYYHTEGFLDARAFSQKRFNEKRTRAFVTFTVEEGPRYFVVGSRFKGNQIFDEEELRNEIDLKLDKPFTEKRRKFAERSIQRKYGRQGYIYTKVVAEPEYTEEEGKANMLVTVKESEQYRLGRVIVRGNTETQDKVVRRAFDHYHFLPGELYNTEAADKAKERLLGAGTFEDVTVTPVGNEPGVRDSLIEVVEGRTGLILFGVGVDTDSGVLGNISLEQRNFDIGRPPHSFSELFGGDAFVGGGQRFRIDFMPGTDLTRGQIKFFEPYIFDQPHYFDFNLFIFRRWRECYLERRMGGSSTLGHRFENDWSVETTFRAENVNISDLDLGRLVPGDSSTPYVVVAPQDVQDVEGGNFLTSVKFGVGCNKTDNQYRPTEGYKLNAGYEQYGAMGGDFAFGAVTAGGTLYRPIYEDITERRTVWAGQLRGAQIVGDAPMFERYYAGGISSLRGFDYRGVSPRAGRNDDPIGSDSLFLAGTEVTHPLFEETLYGKVFCDSGVVSEGRYRVTIGFGLELVVPQLFQMVPMHFDFGIPILRDDEDEEEVFSFSFGLTF